MVVINFSNRWAKKYPNLIESEYFNNMDTKKIRALLMAMELGSLTAAAEELGYTQSGLTHMMNSLEDELGIKVLVRSKGGVRLSPAGRELLPQMQELLRCSDELRSSVEKLIQKNGTLLRLGAYSSVARQWLPAILAELRRVAPEIKVSISTGGMRDIYDGVQRDELDCGIVSYQPTLIQGLHWVALHDDPLLAILPMDAALTGGAFEVENFEGSEFLMPADDFELDILPVLAQGQGHERIMPEFRYTGLDDAAIVSMTAHGLGVSVLSELVMDGISDKVEAVPLTPPAFRRLGIVVGEHLQNDKNIKSFVLCARATMRSMYGDEAED